MEPKTRELSIGRALARRILGQTAHMEGQQCCTCGKAGGCKKKKPDAETASEEETYTEP